MVKHVTSNGSSGLKQPSRPRTHSASRRRNADSGFFKYRAKVLGLLSLPIMFLAGCSDDSSSSGGTAGIVEETYVPYNVAALPMPNDGYGMDEIDGTIALPGEDQLSYLSTDEIDAYYQSYETSIGALDGWGLSNVIKIPIANRNTAERYPLDQDSLKDNVMLIKEDGMTQSNESIEIQVLSTGSEIEIRPLKALDDESVYYIAVNDRVLTQDQLPLGADNSFTRIRVADPNDLPEQEQVIQQQILAAEEAFIAAGGEGNLVYAAQFTTQSVHPILQAMRDNISTDNVHFVGSPQLINAGRKYHTYTTSLRMPSYVPFVDSEDSEPGVVMDTKDMNGVKENCVIDPYDPIPNCPDLYKWMKSIDGQHLTKDNPMPAEFASVTAPVVIYSPTTWNGSSALPTVMFVHGITGEKENAALMAQSLTDQGYLVVAIDQIYHGERALTSENGVLISAENDSAYFVNITSPLTLRSNLHQAIIDQLSLRFALNDASWSTAGPDHSQLPHLVGQSLGGIMSVMVGEQSQDFGDGDDRFVFETANYVVPGQGLTRIMLESNHLGAETETKIKKSPDVQRGIAESVVPEQCTIESTNEECITALNEFVESDTQNAELVTMLEDEIFNLLLPGLIDGVQATIDSGDPANHTQIQTENQQKTLVIQAKGNCGDDGCQVGEYMPDFVIPNNSPNNPLVGTDPLIEALGLDKITYDGELPNQEISALSGQEGIRGYINATAGGHGTYLFPYEGPMGTNCEPSFPNGDTMGHVSSAMGTQQTAVLAMIDTDGQNTLIEDPSTIESATPETLPPGEECVPVEEHSSYTLNQTHRNQTHRVVR